LAYAAQATKRISSHALRLCSAQMVTYFTAPVLDDCEDTLHHQDLLEQSCGMNLPIWLTVRVSYYHVEREI
jgi:hypothetical protein